jgi:hypothetical protein
VTTGQKEKLQSRDNSTVLDAVRKQTGMEEALLLLCSHSSISCRYFHGSVARGQDRQVTWSIQVSFPGTEKSLERLKNRSGGGAKA